MGVQGRDAGARRGGREGRWARVQARARRGHWESRMQDGGGRARVLPVQGGPEGRARYVFKSCLSAGCSCLASPRDSGNSLPARHNDH